MIKKKISVGVVLVCMMLGVTACGGKKDDKPTTEITHESEAKGEDSVVEDDSKEDSASENPATQKEQDVTNAKRVKTAIENSMGNESFYEYLTCDCANKVIEVSESGLSALTDDLKKNIMSDLDGSIPEVCYTENGQKAFYFMVSDRGDVTVYAGDGSTNYEIVPATDNMYQ